MKQIIPLYEEYIKEGKISDYLIGIVEKLTAAKLKSPITKAELDKVAKKVLDKDDLEFYNETFDSIKDMLKNNDNIIVK